VIQHNVVQGSEAWHKLRAGIVTASELHRIITPSKLSLSEQRHEYQAHLLMEWIWGQPILSDEETKWMQAGTDQQDTAMRAYEFETGSDVTYAGFYTTDDGMIGASPDGLVGEHGLLEIKGRKPVLHLLSMMRKEEFALSHRIQVQGQLYVCDDRETDDLYCFSLARSPIPNFVIPCHREKTVQDALRMALDKFTDELLERREWLEREFGPFTRHNQEGMRAATDHLGITDEDADALIAARFNRNGA